VLRSIVVSLAIVLFASGAEAQIAPFGGPAPFTLDPYPFLSAPSEAGANAAGGQRCAPVYTGRGGARYPCAGDDPREHSH